MTFVRDLLLIFFQLLNSIHALIIKRNHIMNTIEASSKDKNDHANIDKLPCVDIDQDKMPIVFKHRRFYSIIMASIMAGTAYYMIKMILSSEFINFEFSILIMLVIIPLCFSILVLLFGTFVFTKNIFQPTYLVIGKEGIKYKKGLFNFKALRPISYSNVNNAYYSALRTKSGYNHILNMTLVSDKQDSLKEYAKHYHIGANLNLTEEETLHHVALVNALIADYNKVA